jgi:hypothetical protein
MWFVITNCLLLFTLLVWIMMSRGLHRRHKRATQLEGNTAKSDSRCDCHGPGARKKFRYSKSWGCY